MSDELEEFANLSEEEIADVVNTYLNLQIPTDEYEDDISFWAANENTNLEQEVSDDPFGIS